VNKSRGGEKLLIEDSWNSDGNGEKKGGNAKSSLFETLGFTKNLEK